MTNSHWGSTASPGTANTIYAAGPLQQPGGKDSQESLLRSNKGEARQMCGQKHHSKLEPTLKPTTKGNTINRSKSASSRTFIMLSNFSQHVFHRNATRCNIPARVLLKGFKQSSCLCSHLHQAAPILPATALHSNPRWLQALRHKPHSFPQSQLYKIKIFHSAHTSSIPPSLTHLQTNCILRDSCSRDLSHT